jgi:arylsulfatase A-like enzyme
MGRPNILLLVVDCLRADFVFQPGLAHVPNLERLAREGFRFDRAVSHCTTTTPSFANLLTGRYSFEHGVRTHSGSKLSPGVRTLAERLREAGYHTRAEVCGPLGPEIGLDRGFDDYHHRGKRVTVHTGWGQTLLDGLKELRAPWFLLLHVWALHRPRQVLPERDDARFGATDYGRALSSIDLFLGRLFDALPPETVTAVTGDHGEEITYGAWDHFVKKYRRKFFKFRKKRGLTRRHVSHGLRDCSDGHGNGIYDPLIRVPLLFHGPAITPGRSDRQVRHIDIAPTLLECAGVDPAGETTGLSLGAMLRGAPGEHRDAYLEAAGVVMVNRDEWLAGIRVEDRYKYIRTLYGTDFAPELYDLREDPGETHNLTIERPDLAADLDARIVALNPWRETGAEMSGRDQAAVLSRLKDLGYHD